MIVYLVFAHRRLGQLERLVRRLRGPDTAFVVHIDARSDLGPGRAHVEALARMTDVSLMPRYRTPWGGIGLVEATLAGLAQALRDHPAAEHVCVLSGQDYPIAPPERIREFFSEGRGATFMEHHPLPAPGGRTESSGGSRTITGMSRGAGCESRSRGSGGPAGSHGA